jgi:hypothetical protein
MCVTGTPSADNPIPGSGNSASSLLERLTASSATSGTTSSSSPYTPLPSTSPSNQPFTSPPSKTQFLSQSPSPKNPQQQQTHFTSPSPKPPATPSPLSSPPQSSVNLNLQGLSLASLQGAMASIQGLQNVQVSAGKKYLCVTEKEKQNNGENCFMKFFILYRLHWILCKR